jgi:TPR repeat protein
VADGFERDCQLGSVQGCLGLASAFVSGRGRDEDPNAAQRLYQKACELDRAKGCYAFGLAQLGGHGVRKDRRHGRELLDLACSAGQPEACRFLAEVSTEP